MKEETRNVTERFGRNFDIKKIEIQEISRQHNDANPMINPGKQY